MFGNSKSRLPAIITFTDGKQLHCEITPGSTPGLMSAISGENAFLDIYVEGKRKYYLRQHVLCIEEDSEAVKLQENAT